jgi:intracellular sulfur oxidation DsrE/DsrF family protein
MKFMRKISQRIACLAVPLAVLAGAAYGQTDKQRVVIQVSDADPAKWTLALNNARNIQQELGKDNVQIEIVAYGPGLPMLKADSAVAGRLSGTIADGVGLMACENTMRNTKTQKSEMHAGVSYVSSGVTHIMKRQREGWSYLRP